MILFLLSALAVTAVAAVYDWRTGHIPNRLTLSALALGVVAHTIAGFVRGGPAGAAVAGLSSLAGALVCGLAPAAVFALGGIGGGDVKLLAAVGAICQIHVGLLAEAYSYGVALVVLPGILIYQGTFLHTLGRSFALVARPLLPRAWRPAPNEDSLVWVRFAPAIFAGTALAVALHT